MNSTANATPLMGRILMSSVFLIAGVSKIMAFSHVVAMASDKGFRCLRSQLWAPLPWNYSEASAFCWDFKHVS